MMRAQCHRTCAVLTPLLLQCAWGQVLAGDRAASMRAVSAVGCVAELRAGGAAARSRRNWPPGTGNPAEAALCAYLEASTQRRPQSLLLEVVAADHAGAADGAAIQEQLLIVAIRVLELSVIREPWRPCCRAVLLVGSACV